jgi:hypothetical protein
LIKKTIQKKWNLDQFLEEAGEREDLNYEIKGYEGRAQGQPSLWQPKET